jgi:hypothetical protein
MPSPRFLALLLLIASSALLAQAQEHSSTPATTPQTKSSADATAPDQPSTMKDLQDRAIAMLDSNVDRKFVIRVDDPSAPEDYCLKMRTYVVTRDSKDSDSVHLTHYSDCQPASRFHVKTTEQNSSAIPSASGQNK